MKITKLASLLGFLWLGTFSGPCFGQQAKVFNWLPANDESVRLDPANYHTGRTYHPGTKGGNIHVDIKAEKPVTIFLASEEEWNAAIQHPETLVNLRQLCLREHVMEITYLCDLPPAAMTLIIRDERNSPDAAVFAGMGTVLDRNEKAERAVAVGIASVLTGQGSPTHRFYAPNDVHIQYYRWDCVENCIQPEYQWIREIKEKYDLTSFLKVYGGFVSDHDGEQVSIKIKSPVPMIVAMLPSQVAGQLHVKPDTLETVLEKISCQQRGVQSSQFECTFNVADGPQSLIVVPESGASVPNHKKAEIEMLAAKCVANCTPLDDKR
jgi:hypothetical protein